jgi:TnpA family transposase
LIPGGGHYAVGTYAHVLDQWGILYDQPIVLNRRQAGPAIEGALRQQHVERLERVAVDTHGFTHFAMAPAKLVGFDLCPRLAKLKKRKLYLPRGLDIPEVLRPCVAGTVSRRAIARGWEGLLRLGASVKHGWYPATEALDRFGSAAAGDPVYEAEANAEPRETSEPVFTGRRPRTGGSASFDDCAQTRMPDEIFSQCEPPHTRPDRTLN